MTNPNPNILITSLYKAKYFPQLILVTVAKTFGVCVISLNLCFLLEITTIQQLMLFSDFTT